MSLINKNIGLLAAVMAMGGVSTGRRRREYPNGFRSGGGSNAKAKNLSNDPERAKGMQPFEFNGTTVYAGTLKAARKKYALLIRNSG